MEVRSGFTNVQSFFGIPVRQLEETMAFERYDFGFNPDPWIPTGDLRRIVAAQFPGCDLFSKQLMTNSASYSDWRTFEKAVSQCGSQYHLFNDGPIRATTVSSWEAGPAHVRELMRERMRAGQQHGYLLQWTIASSSSIAGG